MQRIWTLTRSLVVVTVAVAVLVGTTPMSVMAAPHPQGTPLQGDSNRATDVPTSEFSSITETRENPQTYPQVNNSTIRHQNPDETSDEDTLDELQSGLESRLVAHHDQGSILISQEEYEAAQQVFGDEYESVLQKYRDVAELRNDEKAEQSVANYRAASRAHDQYAATVAEFDETYVDYLQARSGGNETGTRQLARRVNQLGEWATENATHLRANYAQLEEQTDVDLAATTSRIERVQTSVSERQMNASQSTFVPTEVTVTEAEPSSSFLNPMRIQARLTSQGEPIADRRITVVVGEQSYEARTDADGQFFVEYSPQLIARNSTEVYLQYVPAEESAYLGTQTPVPINVEGVPATIEVSSSTSSVGFNETVRVNGRVVAGERPVADVPLNVTLRERSLGQVRTDLNGSFTFEATLPSDVPTGASSVVVSFDVDGRAVEAQPTVRPLRVRPTAPQLAVSAERQAGLVTVSGQLTAGGIPLEAQPIQLSRSGETVATTRTGSNGTFSVQLVAVERESTAVVTFDGRGTNIASESSEVTLPAPQQVFNSRSDDVEPVRFIPPEAIEYLTSVISTRSRTVVGGVVLFVIGFGLVTVLRRRGSSEGTRDTTRMQSFKSAVARTGSVVGPQSLDIAVDSLNEGDVDTAVTSAYATVRHRLRTSVSGDQPYTHRQFYDATLAAGFDRDALRTLTDAYEAVQYRRRQVSVEEAEAALSAARSLLKSDQLDSDS
ncbi:hypothetical protein [Salinigranum halophilum]|uniref:hypothetical protein n=1 Tax=Salinigranum halophilum TaxID=2565931 RepID=UPI0010A86938|nr:hypothetical protein [Salinigranum halophilum]